MPSPFTVNLTDFDRFSQRMENLSDQLKFIIDAELNQGTQDIAGEAKIRAPANDGLLQQAIGAEKIGELTYQVYARKIYAPYMEFGTRANVVIPEGLDDFAQQFLGSYAGTSELSAYEAIKTWCENKGIEEQYIYAIYITLMTKGAKPHPFFFPAINRILPIIQNRILKALVSEAFK